MYHTVYNYNLKFEYSIIYTDHEKVIYGLVTGGGNMPAVPHWSEQFINKDLFRKKEQLVMVVFTACGDEYNNYDTHAPTCNCTIIALTLLKWHIVNNDTIEWLPQTHATVVIITHM